MGTQLEFELVIVRLHIAAELVKWFVMLGLFHVGRFMHHNTRVVLLIPVAFGLS